MEKIKKLYFKYERHISSLGLIAGFVFDAFSLDRVDQFWENLWIGAHLIPAALCIIFINILERKGTRTQTEAPSGRREWIHFWLVFILQFAFGGLLSAFLVFYFRSSTLASSWPFLLLLAAVFACNELLKKHYSRLIFQISVLFISIYSYAIYMTPILLHEIGPRIFLISGLASLIVLLVFLLLLRLVAKERFTGNSRWLYGTIAGIFIVINILYFTNLIPPIPLSLHESGVYHSVTRSSTGEYILRGDDQSFLTHLGANPVFHIDGNPAYVFTAIFSPTKLNTKIYHHWYSYNEKTGKWVDNGKIPLTIIGGRDGGYRTYTLKRYITPGLWRVDVETEQGQDIGRVKFKAI